MTDNIGMYHIIRNIRPCKVVIVNGLKHGIVI